MFLSRLHGTASLAKETPGAQFLMTIANLFKRYERWNPVHPTYGAFWGLGIGVGCGVGWGPGFGPEVIGYVGAGCGVGFSVGVTFVGVGVGLPASGLTSVPYNAVSATGYGVIDFAKYNAVPAITHVAGLGRDYAIPHISEFGRKTSAEFSKLRFEYLLHWNKHAKNAENIINDQLSGLRKHVLENAPKSLGYFSFGKPQTSRFPQILDKSSSSGSKAMKNE
ncbi:uncharacterized protein LOC131041320 isoform X2 [Cryptomeria japonica]|uniref:uncharacterized protein LOC131041320 isoform X2 n=1 Tax=Cryptomeria japonica TaxID=3369 RepID=UPI0027DA2311|nr:uncharacterized protein LOC131041320 isoform X2 [Cryptomeria japonica]